MRKSILRIFCRVRGQYNQLLHHWAMHNQSILLVMWVYNMYVQIFCKCLEYWDKYFAKQKLNINSGEIFSIVVVVERIEIDWLISLITCQYTCIYNQTFPISSACQISPFRKLSIISKTFILIISNNFLLIICKLDYMINL